MWPPFPSLRLPFFCAKEEQALWNEQGKGSKENTHNNNNNNSGNIRDNTEHECIGYLSPITVKDSKPFQQLAMVLPLPPPGQKKS